MRTILLCSVYFFLVVGVSAAGPTILSYSSKEVAYNELHLFIEAMWYKVPAMDVIEAKVSLKEASKSYLCPIFFLRYPDGEKTIIPNVPDEGEGCTSEEDSVTVKFYIWCHDYGGWSIFVFLQEGGVFQRVGRTKLDFPVGEWAVIVVDKETGETVAEVPLFVEISKPTGQTERLNKREKY